MRTVAEWSPTQFDHSISYFPAFDGKEGWVVLPWIQTRDSEARERADYDAVVEAMDEACIERWWFWWQGEQVQGEPIHHQDYEEHRFGHWGPGWYDCIVVRPGTKCEVVAREMADAYEDYPCVDEEKLSEYEWEEASEYWQSMNIGDRIEVIGSGRYGLENTSIFAARRDELPEDIWVSEFIAP